MEVSELRIAVESSLSASELDDLEALVTEARWNQNAKDWRLFLPAYEQFLIRRWGESRSYL
jgi:hypothetical protein